MDDEALELLREIRDIGLRSEERTIKDWALRRRMILTWFAVLAILLVIFVCGVLYVAWRVMDSAPQQRHAAQAAAIQQH
jgi:hypothetical protein